MQIRPLVVVGRGNVTVGPVVPDVDDDVDVDVDDDDEVEVEVDEDEVEEDDVEEEDDEVEDVVDADVTVAVVVTDEGVSVDEVVEVAGVTVSLNTWVASPAVFLARRIRVNVPVPRTAPTSVSTLLMVSILRPGGAPCRMLTVGRGVPPVMTENLSGTPDFTIAEATLSKTGFVGAIVSRKTSRHVLSALVALIAKR